MEAILIPLAKGLLGLIGASSLFLFKVRQNVEIQVERAIQEQEDAELRLLEAEKELHKIQPKEEAPLKK